MYFGHESFSMYSNYYMIKHRIKCLFRSKRVK